MMKHISIYINNKLPTCLTNNLPLTISWFFSVSFLGRLVFFLFKKGWLSQLKFDVVSRSSFSCIPLKFVTWRVHFTSGPNQFSDALSSLILPCGCDTFKRFPCILVDFFMHVTSNQFSDKFNNGNKKLNLYIVGTIFSCILLRCVRYVANNQLSDKFKNGGGLLSSVMLSFLYGTRYKHILAVRLTLFFILCFIY